MRTIYGLGLVFLLMCGLLHPLHAAPATVDEAVKLAGALQMEARYAEARAMLTEARPLAKDDSERATLDLTTGQCWLGEKNFPEATAVFTRIAGTKGLPVQTAVSAGIGLSQVQQAQGHHEEARAELRKLLDLPDLTNEQKATVHNQVMMSYLGERKLEEARAEFHRVFDDPNASDQAKASSVFWFTTTFQWEQKIPEGLAAVKQLLAQPGLGMLTTVALYNQGAQLVRMSPQPGDVRGWYEKILTVPGISADQKAQAYGNIAQGLAAHNDWDGALGQYHKALEQKGLTPAAAQSAHLGLGNILSSAGRADEALAEFEDLTDDPATEPYLRIAAYQGQAGIYTRDKNWAAVITAYQAALKVPAPNAYQTMWLQQGLARVYEQQKDYPRAAESFLQVTRLTGLAPWHKLQAYLDAARNSKSAGHNDEAKADLQAALELPGLPDGMKAPARAMLADIPG